MAVHPNSLANLRPNRSGTKPKYEELKKNRVVTVTDKGWAGARAIALEQYDSSISQIVELIGRGEYKLVKIEK